MLVSIIIPSFQQPHFLRRAIESCLEQDYDELEVIVVDDRSRDASLGLALSYAASDPRVTVIESSENGGLGRARNIGIAHAAGEYLCFLDADDYLLDRSLSARLEAVPRAVAEYGDAVVGVYGDWQHVTEFVDHPEIRAPRANMAVVRASTYTGENAFICSAPLVRRDAVVAAGGFPEGLRMLEDFALWAKMLASGAIFVPVAHVVATYRQRPNSMLRGDGTVVMADHVRIINEWTAAHGVALGDGGAMRAWLGGETPYSYGRMSWNVPSVLGSHGGAAGARAVSADRAGTGVEHPRTAAGLPDFMSDPDNAGLAMNQLTWVGASPADPATALVVGSLAESLEAVAIVDQHADAAVFSADPGAWDALWPVALAGHSVRPTSDISPQARVVDLSSAEHGFGAGRELVSDSIDLLWPDDHERRHGVVFVSRSLAGYPALDAWISTALHATADAGLDPVLMCDPAIESELGGYRYTYTSIEALLGCTLAVAASGPHLRVLEAATQTVVFDPSNTSGRPTRTRAELDEALMRSLAH